MRILAFVFLVVILQSLLTAQNKKADCDLLYRCISSPVFKKNFIHEAVTADTITLFGFDEFRASCVLPQAFDKVIVCSNETFDNVKLVKDNSLLKFIVSKRECVLIYSFFSTHSGRALSFNFLEDDDYSYEIIGYREGDF